MEVLRDRRSLFMKLRRVSGKEIYLIKDMIYKIEEDDGCRVVYYWKFGDLASYDYVVDTADEIIKAIEEV